MSRAVLLVLGGHVATDDTAMRPWMFVVTAGLATPTIAASARLSDHHRAAVIARAQVWEATDIPSMDLKTGPKGEKAFMFNETVECTYVNKKLPGKTRKFACRIEPANKLNHDDIGGMNLVEWSRTPVWKDTAVCVGNLPKSFTGTLVDPQISEDGRQFLADLLVQLSDEQLRGMFEAARVQLRLRNETDLLSGFATVDEWVLAFKAKRDQIVNRRCSSS